MYILRSIAGALLGAAAWAACSLFFPALPPPVRFAVAWPLFTFGPGAAAGLPLTRALDPLQRTIVLLAIGSGLTPILVVFLGYAHAIPLYPYLVCALGGAALATWRYPRGTERPRVTADVAWACVGLAAVAAATGAIAFWHRLGYTGGVQVYGLYDSMDLSYYAVMASEATHTVPPTASFYAGHALNAAFYPQLILTMVHRFAAVPLLSIYFGYGWPAFLVLGALAGFVLVRALTSTAVAFLALALILVGGDFSYAAATVLPHATDQWDYLLWPTNFLSPTMEVLHFNTWAPTLPVFFGALYGIVEAVRRRSVGWTVVTAVLLASLFQFKPFAYMVLMGALTAAVVFAGRDWQARWRLAPLLGLAVILTLPYVYSIARQPDRRSALLIQLFLLPQRMLLKLDLTSWADALAARLAPAPLLQRPALFAIATVIFFAGGLGVRWIGLPGTWRAIRRQHAADAAAWSVLGWICGAGILIPFVLVTDPYVDTLQFYQTGLYILWIFSAAALAAFAARHRAAGAMAIAVVFAVSVPSSIHFLHVKWTDNQRPPRVALTRGQVAIAHYLQSTDPETTVVLHDQPAEPSLIAILSERRVVLGWGHPYYAVGSAGRLADVNAFFDSAGRDPAGPLETLRRYHVTHVVVTDRDQVHPDVLSHLQAVARYADATLYVVPGAVPAP